MNSLILISRLPIMCIGAFILFAWCWRNDTSQMTYKNGAGYTTVKFRKGKAFSWDMLKEFKYLWL